MSEAYNFERLIKKSLSGDGEARSRIYEENTGLIASVIRRFFSSADVEYDDMFQLGSIGLLKAIDKFDTSFNVRFSTYAVPLIIGEIKRYIRDGGGMIKVSREYKKIASKAMRAAKEYEMENGFAPSVSKISAITGESAEDIAFSLGAAAPTESLYKTDENGRFLIDKKADDKSGDIDEKVSLFYAISLLEEREKKIIYFRYFCDMTQAATAKKMGISQVRVSRAERKILEFMHRKMI